MTSPACSPVLLQFKVTSFLLLLAVSGRSNAFDFRESTVDGIRRDFGDGRLTSRKLVEHYLKQIELLNPILNAIIEVNPDALRDADRADRERRSGAGGGLGLLHGIPVLVKDNIATKDRLNTTAGSLALLGSAVPRDAGVVKRLRKAGAVILGKASLSEWSNYRSGDAPNGWSARGGQGRNPYVLAADPCGSSSGSAIAAAANMAAVAVGTETDGSIICPASVNSAVGIKPTVGLTSRSGVIPISPRQDTVGPICRTLSDAVQVLEAIVGYDRRDAKATKSSSKYIPQGGYRQFLKRDGLKGKRIGIIRDFFTYPSGSIQNISFEKHFHTMRREGAVVVDSLSILKTILKFNLSDEGTALLAEFKPAINAYLSDLSYSSVRTLADLIAFNNKHKIEEKIKEYGQEVFLEAQKTGGIGITERKAIKDMHKLSREGIEKLFKEKRLDAILAPEATATSILAIGGYPGITIPAGYDKAGVPFGLMFGGLKGFEPKLIEIAFSFEQATLVRVPPSFKSSTISL